MIFVLLLVGCKKTELSETKQTTKETQSSEMGEKMTDKDYEKIIGDWECIDTDWSGDKVYIRKTNDGIAIRYEDEIEYTAQCVSKSKAEEDTYYNFENIENETMYFFNLKENGNFMLNSGTTHPEAVGLSKPMEYKRISE